MPNSSSDSTLPPPKKNYMWVLCDSTKYAQYSSGQALAADSMLANLLSQAMDLLSKSYIGSPEDISPDTNTDHYSNQTLNWYVSDINAIANDDSLESEDKSMYINSLQQNYSVQNTMMQEGTNELNGSEQAFSNQSSTDQSNLQSLATLASTGASSVSYSANLAQQTM